MTDKKFSRKAMLAGSNILKSLGHSGFQKLILEFGISGSSLDMGSLQDRANALAKYAIDNPAEETAEGELLWNAIVDRAIELERGRPQQIQLNNVSHEEREKFVQSLTTEIATVSSLAPPIDRPAEVQKASFVSQLATSKQGTSSVANSKIFIVHGRDEAMKLEIARFLERLGFEPIILHEQANRGATIIEKFIASSEVAFAVVLLSADDLGGLAESSEMEPRARQNVILEWGYFIGKLGRQNVIALKKGDISLPTDVVGVAWEPFDAHGGWKLKLANELREAGLRFDSDKL
ncbi:MULTISPECIES: TIR domain-containing protein [unclassified Rhizobium]|uniref:TIR domain-containing protein n=1 Tax=unclassified Rhizobium TaxID=2613769 RepID=UPI0007F06B94|nr:MULTISPECIES: nucleotide-binding protein [unclassified Rhizobium]ANK89631.1 TIR-like domain-containing protein [Rhizobium sp. N6212]ANK95658.1 TIR-like domain-containing protein [Rhizobium sp. N621]